VTPCTARVCPLTVIAWRLGALTLSDLWWRYIGVGGRLPQTALAAYLDGRVTWPDTDHNVLASRSTRACGSWAFPAWPPTATHERAARGAAPHPGRRPSGPGR
jgi:hypothetical protein